ncbi:hypothetical protein HAX54_052699, partial [Datura stramonium]|nr:hypothetical protein [Datura stramonium]
MGFLTSSLKILDTIGWGSPDELKEYIPKEDLYPGHPAHQSWAAQGFVRFARGPDQGNGVPPSLESLQEREVAPEILLSTGTLKRGGERVGHLTPPALWELDLPIVAGARIQGNRDSTWGIGV